MFDQTVLGGALRKLALIITLAVGLAGCKSAEKAAPEVLKVGFIYPGPIGDVGWTYQHELGRQQLAQAFPGKVETIYVEKVPEGPDADRVIRDLIDQGCKMIFTTSFGFMEQTLRVAQDHPEVIFEHATGYKLAPNLGVYQTRFYEGAYLLGVLAGKMTKSNVLGFVASHPIPEVLRNINAFTHGARSVNDKVVTKVVWVNSWYDPPKEKEAAEALSNQGADVLYQNTDSAAVVQLGESKGFYAFGQDSDMTKYGPKAHLSANVVNWGPYYVHKVKQVLEGTYKPEDTKWGMAEGTIVLAPLNPAIPPDVVALFEEKKAAILAGKLHPFGGPVLDQEGGVKVPAGQQISDEELWGMKWYLAGVQGKVPGG
jgi:basic membrane protein A and related proteins